MMLLVSIHDVTPALTPQVIRLWELCASRDVIPALFVVPNWHGEWPLEQHPTFIEWIRARAAQGAEIVLHGERHDEAGLPRGLWDSCRAWGRTAGEGEFLSLDAESATIRFRRGLQILRKVGLEPIGVVPPAWIGGERIYRAAAAAGLAFTEDSHSIQLLPSGRRVRSPVVRWSARSPLRAWASVAVSGTRWALQRRTRWPRLALHPRDLDHPAVTRSIGRALDRWLSRHLAGRYSDLTVLPTS